MLGKPPAKEYKKIALMTSVEMNDKIKMTTVNVVT